MPASKLTAAGCPLFLGTVFKDYLETEFKMFLRREGIARVLDPAKDPRKLYVLPELPQSIPEAPATVSARTPVGRATRSGAEEITSSPKTQFAHERFQQSVRTERRVVQEKYDSWDRDCERAFGYLHDAIPAEDRRRVARETAGGFQFGERNAAPPGVSISFGAVVVTVGI